MINKVRKRIKGDLLDPVIHFAKMRLCRLNQANLPDFLIIGAQKSGTTTLRFNLNKHPGIYMPTYRNSGEIKFFSNKKRWQLGETWYMAHFTKTSCLQGEKAPEYLLKTRAHRRISSMIPDVRLIAILRNPVDRAFSQWNHMNQEYHKSKKRGWVKTDFENALRIRKNIIQRGEYIDQINQLLSFVSRDQLYIVISENLKKQPEHEMNSICRFLGVEPIEWNFTNRHVRVYKEPMEKETRQKLLEHYRPYNERLFTFLGYSVPEWDV